MLSFAFVKHVGENAPGGERITELPMFLLAIGLFGSFLGLVGAAVTTGLARLHHGRAPQSAADPREMPTLSRRMLLAAAGLALGVAVLVSAGVVPTLIVTAQNRAVMAFAANAILNVLIAIVLLAAVRVRRSGIGSVLGIITGLLALLLGAALLDAASVYGRHGLSLETAACALASAGDLVAGSMCLLAARGRRSIRPTISPTM
jgi:hypothetical protein